MACWRVGQGYGPGCPPTSLLPSCPVAALGSGPPRSPGPHPEHNRLEDVSIMSLSDKNYFRAIQIRFQEDSWSRIEHVVRHKIGELIM